MLTFSARPVFPLRHAALAIAAFCAFSGPARADAPALNFAASTQVYGSFSTSASSPVLGDVSVSVSSMNVYHYAYDGTPVASTGTYNLAANASPPGADPLYDLVTGSGAYGFSQSGTASVDGLKLRTQAASATYDASGQRVASTPTTSAYTQAFASWSQGFYFAADDVHAAGSYGAILIGMTLDGQFNAVPDVVASHSAQLSLSSTFYDADGSYFSNSGSIYTNSYSWAGSATRYQKLLFQYGTAFYVNMSSYAFSGNNGDVDFSHTGQITSIEIPFDATLVTAADQLGLGSQNALYGVVFNSATADAENTNWDFANNGGGFTPTVPVPEPETWALMLAGLAFVGRLAVRRRPA